MDPTASEWIPPNLSIEAPSRVILKGRTSPARNVRYDTLPNAIRTDGRRPTPPRLRDRLARGRRPGRPVSTISLARGIGSPACARPSRRRAWCGAARIHAIAPDWGGGFATRFAISGRPLDDKGTVSRAFRGLFATRKHTSVVVRHDITEALRVIATNMGTTCTN